MSVIPARFEAATGEARCVPPATRTESLRQPAGALTPMLRPAWPDVLRVNTTPGGP